MRTDVAVLGAGIVGVAAALQIQRKGRSVALIDRRPPGEETSFGNAGLIQREAYYPYAFPRGFAKLLKYGLNGESEAHYHLNALPRIAWPLLQYWLNAAPARVERTIRVNRPLFENCLVEHESLAAEAGATSLLRPGGWIQVYRKAESLGARLEEAERLRRDFGVASTSLDGAALQAIEPHVRTDKLAGAIHWHDPASLKEPVRLTQAYAELFIRKGGSALVGDARSLTAVGDAWRLTTEAGPLEAREVVVAMGPWSSDIYEPLGYRLPLFVKRGYHVHFRPGGNTTLDHPVIDADAGFAMAAMENGIRITTGAEFTTRDAPATPVQVERVEPRAREWLSLEGRVETTPWMGRRPCLPDMAPVIGPAPRHKGLWFLFGHAHHGLTNAAVSGRIIAEMIAGEQPFCDVSGFAMDRGFV